MKKNSPEKEAIDIEMEEFKQELLKLGKAFKKESDAIGKAFEALSYSYICNSSIKDFLEDDTDGSNEFGIDSVMIKKNDSGKISIKILSCKYDKGPSYKTVDDIKRGLKNLFDIDDPEEVKNERIRKKNEEIRKVRKQIEDVKIYCCTNNEAEPEENCLKSRDDLLQEIKLVFNSKYDKKINVDFLFFGSKEIYEKKLRNDNPLSRDKEIIIKYKEKLGKFNKLKEEFFNEGEICGCVVTIDANEVVQLLKEAGDWLFHYNIRGFQGKNKTNKKIEETIKSKDKNKFWFLNNGITMLCEDAIEDTSGNIKLKFPQIVNGQQTVKTIASFNKKELNGVDVILKIYITENENFFSDVALATNSQTSIDYADLSSNRTEQIAIKKVFEKFNILYKNKKGKVVGKYKDRVDSKTLGRISLSTINGDPSLGRKTTKSELIFGELYDDIFQQDPYCLLLSFRIYISCKKNDKGIDRKKFNLEREVRHFGIFHLSSLIWYYLKEKKLILSKEQIIKLIILDDFNDYYKKALVKIKSVIKEEQKKKGRNNVIIKEYFNTMPKKLIFKI